MYGIWFELRSCWFRIGRILRTTTVVDLDPWAEMDSTGRLVKCRRTSGHMIGIEHLLSSRPWASPEDQRLFLEGWDVGARYAPVLYENDIPDFYSEATARKT